MSEKYSIFKKHFLAGGKESLGFTLIEIMVVVAIIGLLATIISVNFAGRVEKTKRTKALADIRALEQALDQYYLDNSVYPSTEQGLKALVEKPTSGDIPPNWQEGGYIKGGKIPLDPWNREYIYISPGSKGPYDIISYGADGQPGGDGKNADITNWDLEVK